MKKLFRKLLNVINEVKARFSKQEQAYNYEYRKPLSPCEIPITDKVLYRSVDELRFAIDSEDCTNIAVTGCYGSGKSSVIKTYLKKNPSKRTLKISLSNFNEKKESQEDFEHFLEFKIFQHILYKADVSRTSQSKYIRILYITHRKAICLSAMIILFFVSIWILLKSKFFVVDSLCDFFKNRSDATINIISDVFSLIYILLFLFFCLYHLIKRWRGAGIKSIKAKYVELEFDKNKSVFSEMLEEILYFLKAGKYDIVLFEDIDRVSDTQSLFLKLREINILLNESEYWGDCHKKIKFVYAIKDDLFTSEYRIKCFDYLIPIIPIVDKYNAGDFLIKNYGSTLFEKIKNKDLSKLGIYINDMRQLINIINEFGLYKDVVIQGEMSPKKLLAIIIYKNLFPDDFSLLQQKKGCLYNIFNEKSLFYKPLIATNVESISQLENKIKEKRNDITNLRSKVTHMLADNYNIISLIIGDTSHSLSEFETNDSLYARLEKNQIDKYYFENDNGHGTVDYNFKFTELIKKIDPDSNPYPEIMYDNLEELYSFNDKLSELRNEVNLIKQTSLQDTIALINDGEKTLSLTTSICEDSSGNNIEDNNPTISEVLHSFIRNGYIAEDYSSYISYYYSGSIKEEDYKFLNSVLQGISLPYDFRISNPEKIINAFYSDNYKHKEILNFDLFSYILDAKDNPFVQEVIQTARQYPDFLVGYYRTKKYAENFISFLFSDWNHCIRKFTNNTTEEDKPVLFEMLLIACPTNISFDEAEISILNGLFEFICNRIDKFDIKLLKTFITKNKLKFDILIEPKHDDAKIIFNHVISSGAFEINLKNLLVIYSDKFNTGSYQSIREGLPEVKKYLDRNISTVIDLFPDTDVEETTDAIVELSNNKDITNEQFEKFLSRQKLILDTFNGVNSERLSFFFKYDRIKPLWINIQHYLEYEDDLSKLTPYIHKNADELAQIEIEEDENKVLQSLLFNDNVTLNFDVYRKLLPCCKHSFKDTDLTELNDERLLYIIFQKHVEYSDDIKDFFASKSPEVFAQFLIVNFDSFISDENFNVKIPNSVGIKILDSTLTLDQKRSFLDTKATILDDEDKIKLSQEICFYIQKTGIGEDTNIGLLTNAMELWQEPNSWWYKISLVNEVNNVLGYDEKRSVAMLNSLGGEYERLSTYRGISYFEDKPENRKLLEFLQSNAPYISKLIYDDSQIKVTYKMGP